MASTLRSLLALTILLSAGAGAADNSFEEFPKIDAMDWRGAQAVCAARPAPDLSPALPPGMHVWTGLPAAVKPFGMRAYVSIDGIVRPLRQIAYARSGGYLAIHYRTLGERAFDVRLQLSGLRAGSLMGTDLTGTLTVSRFGRFSAIPVAGFCGS